MKIYETKKMLLKLTLAVVGIVAISMSAAADDLLARFNTANSWKCYNGGKIIRFDKSKMSIAAVKKGQEASIATPNFSTRTATYKLKIKCHVKRGYLKAVVKHGNNTYSLFNKKIAASDKMKEYEFTAEEKRPGGNASFWLVLTGEAEVENVELSPVLPQAESNLNKLLTHQPLPKLPALKLPDLRNVKVIMQEWHLWFHADIPESGKDAMWQAWGNIHGDGDFYVSSGPLWRRAFNDKIYSYLGPYSAVNSGIIKWQINVMKNSGLDGTTCQMYAERNKGEKFNNIEIFEECVKAGEEIGYGVAVHDEIQFMPSSAKSVDAFIKRAYSALKLAKKYPKGYLRIDGKPLYQYEAWGLPWKSADHRRMMQEVEKKLGEPVYWMVCGPPDVLLAVEEFSGLKAPADTWVMIRKEVGKNLYGEAKDYRWQAEEPLPVDSPRFAQHLDKLVKMFRGYVDEANKKRKHKAELVPWIYPGFDTGTILRKPYVAPESTYDREAYLIRSINCALKAKPRILNFSAWNERREKTSWEPSWNNESSDPFYWVRIMARMKGVEFKEPPLPPKENVDKMMWGILYGIDGTPPVIRGIRAHISEASVAVDALDDGGKIKDIRFSASPLCYVDCTTPGRQFGCFANIKSGEKGLRIPVNGKITVKLNIDSKAGNAANPWVAFKYELPNGYRIQVRPDYPREQAYTRFRLTGWQTPNAVAGPWLWGTGKEEWQTIRYNRLKLTPKERIVTLSFEVKTLPGVKKDPAAEIYLKGIALFPEKIVNDSLRHSFLPNASPNLCTKVMEMPYRLLPRKFFNVPLAVQAFDDSGNFSGVTVFDLTQVNRIQAPGVLQIQPAGRVWR